VSDWSERTKDAQTQAGLRDLEWANRQADPVQQAVDNYLLMERKARAWDALRKTANTWVTEDGVTIANLDVVLLGLSRD
jgi:hypothetical protein